MTGKDFAVQGIAWRRTIDWVVLNLPALFHPVLVDIATSSFFFFAAPGRRALLHNLKLIRPSSSRPLLYLRAFRIFRSFAWMLTDAAVHRLLHPRFRYELEGENFLQELATIKAGIVLTAHIGNYDLGAALFAEKLRREIRIVRAPEPDARAGDHVDLAFAQSSAGAVKVEYSNAGTSLSFDLLAALRGGEIISIQGDRVMGELARASVKFFDHEVPLPTGPFALSFVADAPIYPLFVVRTGYRKYRIIVRPPIVAKKEEGARDAQIAQAMRQWSAVLEEIIGRYWPQWYAFTPLKSARSN
jgi:phosphatidylinositol dimannoside acyltransferase